MAKASTTKKATAQTDATNETKAAPAQPWASNTETPTATNAEASEAAAPADEKTSETRDQQTPSGENPSTEVTDTSGDNGNGSGVGSDADDTGDGDPEQLSPDDDAVESSPDAVTSIERDQKTPAGANPSEQARIDQERVGRGIVPGMPGAPEDVPSEVRDQVTPVGRDLSLDLDDQEKPSLESSAYPTDDTLLASRMDALSPEDQESIRAEISKLAAEAVEKRERTVKAREIEAKMVTGTKVYGNAARRPNHNETLGGLNKNVELNRRARRAAQRAIAEASKPKK